MGQLSNAVSVLMDSQTSWESEFQSLFDPAGLNYQIRVRSGEAVRYVNLDQAATTMPFLEVKEFVNEWFNTYGSVHRGEGQKSRATTLGYDATRERIRKYVGAEPKKYVIFTKNTTESINQAATLWAAIPGKVLVSDIEHSSNLLPWIKHNAIVQYRTDADGCVDLNAIEKILKDQARGPAGGRVKLVTFTACSNITGYSPPIYAIAQLAHRYGALVFADLCQYIPHERVDMLPTNHESHLDFIAFSGHKMYAPYGIGVLVGPKEFFDKQLPYHIGGGNLPYITRDLVIKRYFAERAHDAGTPNAMGPIALSKAMDIYDRVGLQRIVAYEHALVHYAYDKLRQIPGIRVYVSPKGIKHVIPYDLDGFDSRLVAAILAKDYGVGLRAGAFCTYEYIRKLKGITDEEDRRIAADVDLGITRTIPCIVRASFSISNGFHDCDLFVNAMADMAARGPGVYLSQYVQDQKTGNWFER